MSLNGRNGWTFAIGSYIIRYRVSLSHFLLKKTSLTTLVQTPPKINTGYERAQRRMDAGRSVLISGKELVT